MNFIYWRWGGKNNFGAGFLAHPPLGKFWGAKNFFDFDGGDVFRAEFIAALGILYESLTGLYLGEIKINLNF